MTATVPLPTRPEGGAATASPHVEVVVPVHEEEGALAGSIHRLHRFLSTSFLVRLAVGGQVWRFALVGAASTLAYAVLYLALRTPLGAQAANALALAATAVANTAANRRLTFGVRGRDGLGRHHAAGLFVFALGLLLTGCAVALLHAAAPGATHAAELAVLLIASAAATALRYVALRFWVFARAG